jgi:Flp pilus assembly protein TadG
MAAVTNGDAGERGGAAGVESALVWIALLMLIGAVTQVVLVFYSGQLALTAAQSGVAAGRVTASTAGAEQAARGFLQRAAGNALTGPAVSAQLDDGGGVLRVRVTGEAPSLIPGVPMTVDKSAVGALERIVP